MSFWPFKSLHRKLDRLISLSEQIMGTLEQFNQELVEINAATNSMAASISAIATSNAEIAADIDDLLAMAGIPDEAIAGLEAIKSTLSSQASTLSATADALAATAAKHTPGGTP